MKTIQKKDEIKRVSDLEADSLVKFHGYKYVPKSTLKPEKVREKYPANVEGSPEFVEAVSSETKGAKKSKKKG
jgi:hypothetical protein